MRENRTYGSEGGAAQITASFLPLSGSAGTLPQQKLNMRKKGKQEKTENAFRTQND